MGWAFSTFRCLSCRNRGITSGIDIHGSTVVQAPYLCTICGAEMTYMGGQILDEDDRSFEERLDEAVAKVNAKRKKKDGFSITKPTVA